MIDIYQKQYNFFSLEQVFLFPILISIIFAKNFAFKRVINKVLLKFDVKKFVLWTFALFSLYSNCAIESK